MKKALSILVMIVALCLGVWVVAWGMALVSGAVLFSKTLNGVATLIHMPACVERMMFWTFLAPFSILAGRIFAPSRRTRVRASLLLVSVLGVYWTITYAGNQLRPKRVDPEKVDWFSPVTGIPVLYYVHGERYDGGWEFYAGAPEMFHPGTGELIKPVSLSLRRTWEADKKVRQEAAEKSRLAAEETARQAEQQALEQQRAHQALQQQQDALAEERQQLATVKASLETKAAELASQSTKLAKDDQAVAEVQQHYDETLKATEEHVAAERSSQDAPNNEAVRETVQPPTETRASVWTAAPTDESPPEPAAQVAPPPAYSVTSWTPVAYAYVAPSVSYYYGAPVRYYYVAPCPPRIVRWGYPRYVCPQPSVPYRYAPVCVPNCRQMRGRR
ncbi:MAG: coiled-coil domain-containing protein [Verrucomicrobiia bacterium]